MKITDLTADAVEEAIGSPRESWAADCHRVSLDIVRSGLVGESRVARGTTPGVPGQHSWVVLGDDCYDPGATIVDATLWSYVDGVPTVLVAKAGERPHTPKGSGNILEWGQPVAGGGPIIELRPSKPLGRDAEFWIKHMFGPLDLQGWMVLASAPVMGWPSGEIIQAMLDTPKLRGLVPIDVAGMITDSNPNGLYR